jgi:hypothetical protein
MRWGPSETGKAIDLGAAAIFAAAVAFASSMLASGAVAATIAPPALLLVYAGLRRVDDAEPATLAIFELTPIDAPQDAAPEANDEKVVRLFNPAQLAIARPSAASPGGVTDTRLDAGQALSDALAQLKRSLR